MTDAIDKVQAMVGCPHYFPYETIDFGIANARRAKVCAWCDEPKLTAKPAPDCSTLWGALQAAERFNTVITVGPHGTHCYTEREAIIAVCELILKAVE